MKKHLHLNMACAVISAVALSFSWLPAAAQDNAASTAPANTPPLTYGVSEVLQLANAKVGDDLIISYIQNSGTSYGGLSANEIVYLHQQGVSDRVVNTMLAQRGRLAAAAEAQQAATAAPTAYASGAQYQETAPPVSVTYVQPEPVSTVYVLRDSSPRLVDYGIYPRYPYYGSYYYNCVPRVSFGFSFGGVSHAAFHGGRFYGGHGGFHH